jgi:hypothetical protein
MSQNLWNRLLASATVALLCTAASRPALATSHIFIRNAEGVWLGSDTLNIHNDGLGHITSSTVCKVSIVRNRLIFNAGFFKNLPRLKSQEDALPLEPLNVTIEKLFKLMEPNHMDIRDDPHYSNDLFVVNVGIVQVSFGQFDGEKLGQTDEPRNQDVYTKEFKIGVPHGYGDVLSRETPLAVSNPRVAQQNAANPKTKILRLLREEAKINSGVRAPFTILLLRNDGTVSDFSDKPVCTIPNDAAYKPSANNSATWPPRK